MRCITEHRLNGGGFEAALTGVLRNSPWYCFSLAVHLIAALVIWNVPFRLEHIRPARALAVLPTGTDCWTCIEEEPPLPEEVAPQVYVAELIEIEEEEEETFACEIGPATRCDYRPENIALGAGGSHAGPVSLSTIIRGTWGCGSPSGCG